MDVLREREVKDSLERQLQDEQKVRGEYESVQVSLASSSRSRRRLIFTRRRIEAGSREFAGGGLSRLLRSLLEKIRGGEVKHAWRA